MAVFRLENAELNPLNELVRRKYGVSDGSAAISADVAPNIVMVGTRSWPRRGLMGNVQMCCWSCRMLGTICFQLTSRSGGVWAWRTQANRTRAAIAGRRRLLCGSFDAVGTRELMRGDRKSVVEGKSIGIRGRALI